MTNNDSTRISIECENGHRFQAKAELAGKTVKCPKCHGMIPVPSPKTSNHPTDTATPQSTKPDLASQDVATEASNVPKGPLCRQCHGPIAIRVDSISAYTATTKKVCIQCDPQLCMVYECQNPASVLIHHHFSFGSIKKETGVQNDIWICEQHRPDIEKEHHMLEHGLDSNRSLKLHIGAIAVAGLIVIANFFQKPGLFWTFAVGAWIAVSVAVYRNRIKGLLEDNRKESQRLSEWRSPVKKQEFAPHVIGSEGTVWRDKYFDGEFVN